MKRTLAAITKQIAAEQKKIAACRDRLRELSEEAEELANDLDMADEGLTDSIRDLEIAIDTLSLKQ